MQSDIQTLNYYLQENCSAAVEDLRTKFNYDDWRKLSENALIAMQLFNRSSVPALLDKELVEFIKDIIKYRKQAGVKQNNPYIFGIPVTSGTTKPT